MHAEPLRKPSSAPPAPARAAAIPVVVPDIAPSPAVQRLEEISRSLNARAEVVAQRARGERLSAAASVAQRAPANRTGLPDGLKAGVEALSGHSLDDVRVHRNSGRPALLQAHAYAQGTDIHLAPGQERHLPHEAWHVVQQKQGRVRPTMQLRGAGINDDAALEREAEVMGARAARTPDGALPPLRPAPGPAGTAPMQMIFVIRNGQWIWEDPYVPQDGDQAPGDFMSRPSVLMGKGTREVVLDPQGGTSSRPHGRRVPTHKSMQTTREQQGATLRALLKQNPGSIKSQSAELASLTDKLEARAQHALPKNHKLKVEKLIRGGSISGENFRGIHPAQDEITQSQATAHFLQGFRTPFGTGVDPDHGDLEEYAAALLRLMSSLRIPTSSVVAPINYGGTTTGQQHPTDDDQPKLQGGGSGHSYADRNRVEAQIRTFASASTAPGTSANAIVLASVLSAAVTTLSTMSAPTTASNVASFNLTRQNQQVQEREALKSQTNLIATELGYSVTTEKQSRNAPWMPQDVPTSPIRVDPSELQIDTTAPITGSPLVSDHEVQRLILAVQRTALQLLQALPDLEANANNPALQQFASILVQVYNAADLLDASDPQNVNILYGLHTSLNQLFLVYNGLLRRRTTPAPYGNVHDPAGQRLPSLEQFFGECGQMAAHNALVLENFPDLAHPGALPALLDPQELAALGGFQNFITEDEIREMLVAAHRPAIPVIGNLDQAGAVVDLLRQGALMTLLYHNIGDDEQQAAQSLINFIDGHTHSVVMVVNTTGDQDLAKPGDHWISLRVTRQQNGALGIQYLDSLQAPVDYTQLFHALRAFLAHVPQQSVQNVQQGSDGGTGGGGTSGDFNPDDFFADFVDYGGFGESTGQIGLGTFGGGGTMDQQDEHAPSPMDGLLQPGTPTLEDLGGPGLGQGMETIWEASPLVQAGAPDGQQSGMDLGDLRQDDDLNMSELIMSQEDPSRGGSQFQPWSMRHGLPDDLDPFDT